MTTSLSVHNASINNFRFNSYSMAVDAEILTTEVMKVGLSGRFGIYTILSNNRKEAGGFLVCILSKEACFNKNTSECKLPP